jgi:site-specific DNA-methyltransferase (adenine-specific)
MNDIFNDNVPLKTETPAFAKHVLPAVPSSEVYLEDCVKALKRYADNHFDLAIVDPPYGAEQMWQSGGNTWGKRKEMKEWEIRPTKEYFDELIRVSKNQIVWGGNYFIDNLYPTRCMIVWDKVTRNMWADGEIAWTSFNENIKILAYAKSDAVINDKINLPRIHPTQKPVKLYDFCLHHFAKPNDLILDTHLGSGSSRIAAYKGGFNFVGFEIDQEYYEKQEKRFNDFKSQLRLF